MNVLGGGQTRSEVELVADLAVSYDDLVGTLQRLTAADLVDIEYEQGGERFYSLAETGVAALKGGGDAGLEAALDAGGLVGDQR